MSGPVQILKSGLLFPRVALPRAGFSLPQGWVINNCLCAEFFVLGLTRVFFYDLEQGGSSCSVCSSADKV